MRKLVSFVGVLLFVFTHSFCSGATPFNENQSVSIKKVAGHAASGDVVGTVATNGYKLNVRSGPWGKIVGSLSDKKKVKIIGSSGDWYKIKFGGKTRYIHKNYVSAQGKKATKVAPHKAKTKYINTPGTSLNIRTGPWGKIVGTLSHNTKIQIIGESGDWYKIGLNGKTRYIYKKYVKSKKSTTTKKATPKASTSSSSSTYKASVIGDARGDGTVAGAVTWARDQVNGTKKGYNSNNGKTSKNSKAWSGWCLAFVGTSYGRKKPLLAASSAIKSYYKCKAAGKIRTNRNPPAGAAMFTGTTSGNPYGHIFIATGKMNKANDPIIITSTGSGIKEMPMSKMWKGGKYLGWALP